MTDDEIFELPDEEFNSVMLKSRSYWNKQTAILTKAIWKLTKILRENNKPESN